MTGKFSQNRRAESDQKEGEKYLGDLKYRTLFSANIEHCSQQKKTIVPLLIVEAGVPEGVAPEKLTELKKDRNLQMQSHPI